MPKPTATITAGQREAIYQLIRDHLSGFGDVNIALEIGNYDAAERLGHEFGQDMRLLADLGWQEHDDRRAVPLTMPAAELDAVVRRLRAQAAEAIVGSSEEREAARHDEQITARYQLALEACDELIAGIDPGEGESA